MEQHEEGYWQLQLTDCAAGTRYQYQLNHGPHRPDPASHYQPEGVHGPSEVVNHHFNWTDQSWRGVALEDMILYELHVGTFTPEGTFEAIIPRLPALKEVGITAIELMPVAQFPGDRNWGYDGVDLYAVQNSYGGPLGLKRLVNACHDQGIAVVLDVVYNHFGPEGNYIEEFGPYFTESYRTIWGKAINFDGPHSHHVRNFFLENVLYWLDRYHIDALRLDAIQAIYDFGAMHFLQEMATKVDELAHKTGRKHYLMAESDLNDVRIIRPTHLGGYGLDAQWSDDFHHALYTLLTGENRGYYQDFGQCEHLAKAYQDSFVYDWRYAPHRHRYHGAPVGDRPPTQFVVAIQNHDQVANCLPGNRLSKLVSFEALKLAAGAVILSPYIPLLFMGEEYGEDNPFMYFISHSEPAIIDMVRKGRKEEFASFNLEQDPPDAQDEETFRSCILEWSKRDRDHYAIVRSFYQHLIQLRRTLPALVQSDRRTIQVFHNDEQKIVYWRRWSASHQVLCVMNFNSQPITLQLAPDAVQDTTWNRILDSTEHKWNGPGSLLVETLSPSQEITLRPQSLVLYGSTL